MTTESEVRWQDSYILLASLDVELSFKKRV